MGLIITFITRSMIGNMGSLLTVIDLATWGCPQLAWGCPQLSWGCPQVTDTSTPTEGYRPHLTITLDTEHDV